MLKPYNDKEPKGDQVRRMFNRIAPVYDVLNRRMSLGLDVYWRRKAVEMLVPFAPVSILDVAAGTADLSICAVRNIPGLRKIIGVDISEEMLRLGREKVAAEGLDSHITLQKADALHLPFEADSFDALTIGFGLRNFEDIPAGVRQALRVLKPSAPMMVLELSEPKAALLCACFRLYSRLLIPRLGRAKSADKDAYRYLPHSVSSVPQGKDLCDLFLAEGFRDAYCRTLPLGVATIYMAIK